MTPKMSVQTKRPAESPGVVAALWITTHQPAIVTLSEPRVSRIKTRRESFLASRL